MNDLYVAATPPETAPPSPPKLSVVADERPRHRWRFFRAGGVDQVLLESGADLVRLGELDQKLWVALAMPTRGVDLDARTLELVDRDGDRRIRAPDIVAAVDWVAKTWREPDDLLRGDDRVELAALLPGPALEAARRVLTSLGRATGPAATVTLADSREAADRFAALALNGDGVIPADTVDDPDVRKLVEDIVATLGGVPDRGGKPGADRAKLGAFLAGARELVDWQARAEVHPAELLPFGAKTADAAAAMVAVRERLDDYFTRCRLGAFDPRVQPAAAGGSEAALAALADASLSPASPALRALPLARVEPGRALPLRQGLNPAWADAIGVFADLAVGGRKTQLTEEDWGALQTKLAPHLAWAAARPDTPVAALGVERLRAVLEGDAKDKLGALIAEDLARAFDLDQIALVEKLVLFQRDLFRLLKNFVNFSDFYARKGAVFEAGTLYLDARSCELCFRVSDPSRHALLAGLAGTYIVYCDCTRPGEEKMTIACALTGGDSDNVMIGRNGVFYDRRGRDWDATVTKIISNPISVREAFFAPYKKFVRMLDEQFTKRAAAAEAESHARLSKTAEDTAHADLRMPSPPAPSEPAGGGPSSRKIDVGTVAAIGVAIGGIGAMIAGVLGAFFGLGAWMPIGLLALVLMISGPSMMLAYLKLRRRNLGPILDAMGWAVNGRAIVNVPFGGVLTDLAKLPPHAARRLRDPYAERRRPWRLYLTALAVLVLAVAWYLGRLDAYLPDPVRSTKTLGKYAPAAK